MANSSFFGTSGTTASVTSTIQTSVDAAATSATNAETAKTAAETAKSAAETAKTAAETAKADAEKLAVNAEDSQFTLSDSTTGFSALHHREKANDAQSAAESAKTSAESARDTASNHKDDAEKLATTAEDSQFTLSNSSTGYSALHYNAKAQAAKTAAETAKTDAETAKTAAEAANNSFQALYRTGTSNPTDSLDAGDLFYRTDTGSLLIYSGSAWEAGVTSGSGFVSQSGGSMTGDLQMNNADIIFEGSTADANETTLTVTDPTADRTVTIPDKTGTVVTVASDGTTGQLLRTDGSGNYSFVTVATNLSNDSNPTLSGDLDVATHDIVSSSNNDISLLPNGTGKVIADGNGSTGGISLTDGLIEMRSGTSSPAQIDLYCEVSNAHKVSIKSPAHTDYSGNVNFTLPASNGTNGQVLTTDGSGNLSYTTVDLTALSASNLTSGTIPDARFPATLPAVSGANLTGISTDLVGDTTPQLGGNLDTNGNSILFGSSKWSIELDTGDNDLLFKYNGTTVFKLASSGAVVSADNVTAYGTP